MITEKGNASGSAFKFPNMYTMQQADIFQSAQESRATM